MLTINFEPPIKTRFVWLRAQYALDLRWVRLWLLSAGYIRNQEFYIPVYLKLDIHRERVCLCFSARDIYIRVFTDLRHLMIDIQQVRTWILFLLEIYCIFSPFHFIVIRRVENTVKDVIMENYNDVSRCSSGINLQLFHSISFYLFVLCKRYTDMFTILEIMDFIVLFVHGDVVWLFSKRLIFSFISTIIDLEGIVLFSTKIYYENVICDIVKCFPLIDYHFLGTCISIRNSMFMYIDLYW